MRHIARLVRSASLNGYVDLVGSLGRDPYAFMRTVGLQPKFLQDSEMLIPRDAVRELLEITARATQTEDLALRLAAQRRLSALGPISLVLREDPTPRAALDTLCRYLKLVNASLLIHVEDSDSVVVIREDLLPTPGLAMRQSVELAVGTMFRMLGELIGEQWRPLEVCFTHRPPKSAAAHKAFFGRSVKFNQEFNGLVCLASDLSRPRASGDPVAAGFARKYLEAALTDRHESAHRAIRQVILALLPGGTCTVREVARFCTSIAAPASTAGSGGPDLQQPARAGSFGSGQASPARERPCPCVKSRSFWASPAPAASAIGSRRPSAAAPRSGASRRRQAVNTFRP